MTRRGPGGKGILERRRECKYRLSRRNKDKGRGGISLHEGKGVEERGTSCGRGNP